jgi:hypothetical protein
MKNNTSWTPYNPEYSEPILNQDVQNGEELRLLTDEQREFAAEQFRELIETSRKEIMEES